MFKNDATIKDLTKERFVSSGSYSYNKPPKYFMVWSRPFQMLVSQAGTYLLTKKFHNSHFAIYKCEGGCHIDGVGDLVLNSDSCHFDHFVKEGSVYEQHQKELANLISTIVLEWDPEKPIESMIESAAKVIGVAKEELGKIMDNAHSTPFDGDALNNFFDHNPFAHIEHDKDYMRFCYTKIWNKSEAEFDQKCADEELGKDLLKRINATVSKADPGSWRSALCCSPRRFEKGGLHFWINTGRCTQIDGWKTKEEIEKFIASDGKLIDTMRG